LGCSGSGVGGSRSSSSRGCSSGDRSCNGG
jgi:hypothetical protein